MTFIIPRPEGQDIGAPPTTPAPPWELPGDEGQAHAENSLIFDMPPPLSGDHEKHLSVHLSFLKSPLGQALPKKIRTRLIEHVFDHLAEILAIPDEGGIPATPMQQAARIATMRRDYANGTG